MPLDLRAFALQLYRRPGVESACLDLQAQGADICLLLCGAWLEARGISCTSGRCAALRQLAQPWQAAVVAPLRRLRQDWRTAARDDTALNVLRERLKALELDAEWELLRRLEAACRDWPAEPGAGDAWLEGLMETTADSCDALETLRAATHAD
ncbi:TIGR02444 family protein [Azotobacter beijerinckii]|uniref:TIGR02444 family protein n=1 Tax=Azotobacter beijerinckii TaxID=170623 RepID=UPI002954D946|nr:TIGR02444 family protein [Azotobacter beijerinckii]MDV7211948.1 TIGR02444 family protein [Azotobacter beijerinckii]